MVTIVTPSRSATGRPEQISTRIVFFVAGFGMAAWAPLVPFAKARAAFDEGALGLLLLCLGIGSIVTMPLAGAPAARFGCRRVVVVSAVIFCLTLPLLATVSSPALLAAGLQTYTEDVDQARLAQAAIDKVAIAFPGAKPEPQFTNLLRPAYKPDAN